MDSYNGKKLNAPNDVVVGADGAVWFTDPGFGILGNYEGHLAPLELPPQVYRFDPKTGGQPSSTPQIRADPTPLLSRGREEAIHYRQRASRSRTVRHPRLRCQRRQDFQRQGVRVELRAAGTTDGMRTDVDGNLWCSMGSGLPGEDGVRCYAPNW